MCRARAGASGALAVDEQPELDALDVLHHEEERAVVGGAEVGDVDDVGVLDARGGARLAPETLDQIGRARVRRVQDLDRHALADLDVLGLVDAAHAAFAAQALDVVAAGEQRPDHARAFFERLGRGRRLAAFAARPRGAVATWSPLGSDGATGCIGDARPRGVRC